MKKVVNIFVIFFFFFCSTSIHSQIKKWTLRECVDYALKNNISIKQSELDVKLSEVEKKSAFGNFLPNINGSVAHSWSIGANTNPVTNLRENQTTQYSQLGLSSNVEIYNGLQKQNTYRKAKLSAIASQYNLDKMRDDISLNVANAYLQVLFNREALKVQTEQLAFDEKQLSRTNELIAIGTVPKGDLLDSKATVASDKQKVVEAENNLFLSKLSLAQLLQLEEYQNFDIEEANYEPQKSEVMLQKPEDIISKAKQERIELKIAKTNLEIAEKNIKIAKSNYQPTLSVGYSFGTNASYSDRLIGVDGAGNPIYSGPLPVLDQFSNNKGHNFGLNLQIPIFNGSSVKYNVERSKIALDRAKIAEEQASQDMERNVYTAIVNAKGALNSYESATSTLESRQQAFDYAKEKFTVGMMNSFDFSQSQTLLVSAQSEVLRTKYDYIFKVKVVEYYFGIPIIEKQ